MKIRFTKKQKEILANPDLVDSDQFAEEIIYPIVSKYPYLGGKSGGDQVARALASAMLDEDVEIDSHFSNVMNSILWSCCYDMHDIVVKKLRKDGHEDIADEMNLYLEDLAFGAIQT